MLWKKQHKHTQSSQNYYQWHCVMRNLCYSNRQQYEEHAEVSLPTYCPNIRWKPAVAGLSDVAHCSIKSTLFILTQSSIGKSIRFCVGYCRMIATHIPQKIMDLQKGSNANNRTCRIWSFLIIHIWWYFEYSLLTLECYKVYQKWSSFSIPIPAYYTLKMEKSWGP